MWTAQRPRTFACALRWFQNGSMNITVKNIPESIYG